jgi:hypothetical protein
MGRGDHPVEPCVFCQARQGDDAGSRSSRNTHAPQRSSVHARQYRHAQKRRSPLLAGHCLSRRPHHGDAAKSVDVNQPHLRQFRRCGDRARDRIWDVVELEIEEYLKA